MDEVLTDLRDNLLIELRNRLLNAVMDKYGPGWLFAKALSGISPMLDALDPDCPYVVRDISQALNAYDCGMRIILEENK